MLTRRQFLYLAGAGGAGWIAASAGVPWIARPAAAARTGGDFEPDVEFALTAVDDEIPIFRGETTSVWRYRGEVVRGPSDALTTHPNSYLGPTFHVRQGQKVRIHFANAIAADTVVHWHGLHVPAAMDGHPRFAVGQGGRITYEFTVHNRAGTYWYHPHPHGRTGHQVYGGMAGLFLVSDDEERPLDLPSGDLDVPLVIQDRVFSRDNQLVYLPGGMMDRMNGVFGDTILVNGRPDFSLSVATRVYRLRVLNGSNARIYRLAWNDGSPLTVIGTDGGLLRVPVERASVMLGPGERVELWADFSRYAPGTELALRSLPVEDGAFGRGRGMMRRAPGGNTERLTIMRVTVDRAEPEQRVLPARLSSLAPAASGGTADIRHSRRFHLAMNHMRGTINGRTFQMEAVAPDEIVRLGSSELWQFANGGGGMGMMRMDMPHPMHLHGLQFRVVERRGGADEWVVDEGLKDTLVVMPGEQVTLLVRFERYPGLFLYHCHNLEHEDMGMMRNYYVTAEGAEGPEPHAA